MYGNYVDWHSSCQMSFVFLVQELNKYINYNPTFLVEFLAICSVVNEIKHRKRLLWCFLLQAYNLQNFCTSLLKRSLRCWMWKSLWPQYQVYLFKRIVLVLHKLFALWLVLCRVVCPQWLSLDFDPSLLNTTHSISLGV